MSLNLSRWLPKVVKILSVFFVLWIVSFIVSDDVQSKVLQWTQAFGYVVIFPWIVLANIVVGLPSSFLPIGIGVASSQGAYTPAAAIAIITIASLVGDVLAYALARRYRHTFLKWLGVSENDPGYQKAYAYVSHGGGKRLVFITRFLFGAILGFVNYAAGILRMPFLSFFWLALLGELVWSLIWFGVGYYPFSVSAWIRGHGLLSIGIALAVIASVWYAHLWHKRRNKSLVMRVWYLLVGKVDA
ncbi:MAG: VTT domain-containing protein [bacterium]|nr:VTT domain-containing protein [bacterium]